MKDTNDVQQEVRIKDELGHYLGKVVNGIFYAYCKRCKEHHKVIPGGGKENKHVD